MQIFISISGFIYFDRSATGLDALDLEYHGRLVTHGMVLDRRADSEQRDTMIYTMKKSACHEPHISTLLGAQHRHLCKAGPCRYTIVKPFLFQRSVEQGAQVSGGPTEHPEPGSGTTMATDDNSDNSMTAVILAGDMARRMGGVDKGLIELNGRPMIEYIIEALQPQVGSIVINANRNLEQYRRYGYPVVEDIMGDYFGPLVGMASDLQ